MSSQKTVQVWDYVVIAVMLFISTSIGLYYRFTGGRQKTREEYYTANRSMSAVTVAIGSMVPFFSTISLLGTSAENCVYGTQYIVLNFGSIIAIPFVTNLYLPVFFKLQATSASEVIMLSTSASFKRTSIPMAV